MKFVFLDGQFLPEEEAKLPLLDRSILYGDGLYTTLLVEEGRVCFLEAHLFRLKMQCQELNILPPIISKEAIFDLLEKNDAMKNTWRLKIYISGGGDVLRQSLFERAAAHVFMTLDPFYAPPYEPLKLAYFPYPVMAPHASFKSLSCLHRFYVADYAEKKGVSDAVSFTESGLILEASFGNLFWVEGSSFYTPDPDLPIYFGVTIEKVIEAAETIGLKVEFVKKRLSEIPNEAFLFRTNTLREIRPIGQIEERKFPRSLALEKDLRDAYGEIKYRQGVAPLLSHF